MGVTRRLRLFGWTVANMRRRQLLGVVERAGRNYILPALPVDFDARYDGAPPAVDDLQTEPLVANTDVLRESLSETTRGDYRERVRRAADGQVTFLNETVDVSGDPVDWDHDDLAELPRLWRLKLHGFEPLWWLVTSVPSDSALGQDLAETFESWVRDWQSRYPVGSRGSLRREWAPYAVTNRVRYWCRFCVWARSGGLTPSPELRAGIRKNARYLSAHVEEDVGGNHLVENALALVMAGVLLPCAEDLLEQGMSILDSAASEQFLADGGHFERSPMYHIAVLACYLTAVDLCERAGRPYPNSFRETAQRGLAFLETLTPPDDRIPLLNDAVFDEALSLGAVRRYADAIAGFDADDRTHRAVTATASAMPESGYYWLGGEESRLLVDGGPVGPPHLPGHSHNDLLAVLWWVDGQRVVADTGTYSYEPGERRQYARGIRGHSTVQVGSREPIELGRRFLMGERTAPESTYREGPVDAFRGTYTAPSGYTHARQVYGTDSWWLVWDRLQDTGTDPVRSRLGFHPDVSVGDPVEDSETGETTTRAGFPADQHVPVTGPDGCEIAWVHPVRAETVRCESGQYFPRFGEEQSRDVLVLTPEADAEGGFGYVLTTSPQTSVRVQTDGTVPRAVELESTTTVVTGP